jgi:hypothetical protein
MIVRVVSDSNKNFFEGELDERLREILNKGSVIRNISYSTCSTGDKTGAVHVQYTAFIEIE